MIRALAAILLALPLWASAATISTCWDGTRSTAGCPPQTTVDSTSATSSSVSITYTVAGTATKAYYYVGLPTGGQCVRPALSVLRSGAGAEYHDDTAGYTAGQHTETATGLEADTEYCQFVLAENGTIPANNVTTAAANRYAARPAGSTYTPNAEGTMKWNPGHYMMATVGDSVPSKLATRKTHYDAITNSTTVKGVVTWAFWGNLEPTNDNYNWSTIQEELDYLKALNVPKRLFIRMLDKRENSDGCTNRTYYPQWVVDAGWCVQTRSDALYTLKWWDNNLKAEYIELLQAMAAEFDGDPYFEGIVIHRETGIGQPQNMSIGFNKTTYVNNMRDIALAAKNAFATSNVIMYTNFISGGGDPDIEAMLAWQLANGVGEGTPDTAPTCVMPESIWANANRSGGLDCLDGWYEPQPTESPEVRGSPSSAYNYTHDYLQGQVPIAWSVETSQLGSNSVGQTGGYSASLLRRYADEYVGVSHLFWMRNETYGAASQKWSGSGGILDTINANPTLSNTACPASHVARGGCVTGGTE